MSVQNELLVAENSSKVEVCATINTPFNMSTGADIIVTLATSDGTGEYVMILNRIVKLCSHGSCRWF